MPATLAQLEQLTSRRRYVPAEIWGIDLDLDKFENYDWDSSLVTAPSTKGTLCPRCMNHVSYDEACILAIDGACRNNGRDNAKAACGVFTNIGSELNSAFVVSESRMPTNQRAELHAAVGALRSVEDLYNKYHRADLYDEVIIKTDSAYLVHGMTSWINDWRSTGYLTAQNTPVTNQDLFKTLDSLVFTLGNQANVQVRFWCVPRGRNRPADKLANAALDQKDWKSFGMNELFAQGPKPYAHSCTSETFYVGTVLVEDFE